MLPKSRGANRAGLAPAKSDLAAKTNPEGQGLNLTLKKTVDFLLFFILHGIYIGQRQSVRRKHGGSVRRRAAAVPSALGRKDAFLRRLT